MMKPLPADRASRLMSFAHRTQTVSPDAQSRSLAVLAADLYSRLELASRARMLANMLQPVGSLALAVVGGGAFAKFITRAEGTPLSVSADDAARTTPVQVYELARYVQQSDPGLLRSVLGEARRWLGHSALPDTSFG